MSVGTIHLVEVRCKVPYNYSDSSKSIGYLINSPRKTAELSVIVGRFSKAPARFIPYVATSKKEIWRFCAASP
jgi:hypothetical protein